MNAVDSYRRTLRSESDWRGYLLHHARSPEHGTNDALAIAVAEEGDRVLFGTLASAASTAGPDSPEEFLIYCGVVGLGRLVGDGDDSLLETLKTFVGSGRGNLRAAVVLALQQVKARDIDHFLHAAEMWMDGSHDQMAVVIDVLCDGGIEPRQDVVERCRRIVSRARGTLLAFSSDEPALDRLRKSVRRAEHMLRELDGIDSRGCR